ncbi:MAG: Asp-tRNA(Asn)/Glu-tRNA(Gln) amidotransferase subunit GatC [Kiritimatiellae bacterium]|nr:Asp-tRNA(Asn)/Glu-tRNA(Gln) amidotransferase subunit GatC [Kiritimatiellia bacterium]
MANEADQGGPEKIDVRYVANLARLYLDDSEVETFQGQLEGIVEHVKQIGELDLAGIEPTSHARPVQNVLREDVVRAGLGHELVMDNAPKEKSGQFSVPQIIE